MGSQRGAKPLFLKTFPPSPFKGKGDTGGWGYNNQGVRLIRIRWICFLYNDNKSTRTEQYRKKEWLTLWIDFRE